MTMNIHTADPAAVFAARSASTQLSQEVQTTGKRRQTHRALEMFGEALAKYMRR